MISLRTVGGDPEARARDSRQFVFAPLLAQRDKAHARRTFLFIKNRLFSAGIL